MSKCVKCGCEVYPDSAHHCISIASAAVPFPMEDPSAGSGKTHFADDETLARIVKLEREVAMLKECGAYLFWFAVNQNDEHGVVEDWQSTEMRNKLADAVELLGLQNTLRDFITSTKPISDDFVARIKAEALRDVLPVTADGEPIVPDMTVYCIVGSHVDERIVIGPYGNEHLLTHEPARYGFGGGQVHRKASSVYAVRENALAGLHKGKE